MSTCATCGNAYDGGLEVRAGDATHAFDSFECAIHLLAPRCGHCGCTVIGHGTQVGAEVFCCAPCARAATGAALVDRVDA